MRRGRHRCGVALFCWLKLSSLEMRSYAPSPARISSAFACCASASGTEMCSHFSDSKDSKLMLSPIFSFSQPMMSTFLVVRVMLGCSLRM